MQNLKVVLIGTNKRLIEEWERQWLTVANVQSSIMAQIYHGTLESLPPLKNITKCSIVSPANSIIGMKGGFDNSICKLFSNDNNQVENWIRKDIKFGYKPIGSCEIVAFNEFPDYESSKARINYKIDSVLIIPTMHVPKNINTVNQIEIIRFVFDWVWEILCTVLKQKESRIDCLILPGLGTGWGGLPVDLVSKGMIGALSIWGYENEMPTLDKGLLCLSFLNEDINEFYNEGIAEDRNALFKTDQTFSVINDDVGDFFNILNK